MKNKAYSTREFAKILNKNGYEMISCRGDHFKFQKGNDKIVINKDINKMVCRRLIKTHKLKYC